MNRQSWFVGAAFSALAACAPSVAHAQGQAATGAYGAGATAQPGTKPAARPASRDDGPFAPKGKTGKLRDEAEEVEVQEAKEKEVRKNGAAGLDMVLGTGKTGSFADPTEVFAASFVVSAGYFLTPDFRLSLLVPFATGHIKENGTADATCIATCSGDGFKNGYNVSTFGNVALNASYFVDRSPHTDFAIDLTLAAPTTSGDRFGGEADRRAYVLNRNVIASRAFENSELFESKRFGLVPGASFGYHRRWLRAEAFTDLPILIQTGGQDPPAVDPDTTTAVQYEIKSVALHWQLGVQGFANVISQRLDLGLRAYGTVLFVDPIEAKLSDDAGKPSKFQFVLEPQAVGKFGNIRAGLGFIWPLGGQLGDQVHMYGLRLNASYLFQ